MKQTVVLLTCLLAAFSTVGAAENGRPNIIVIITDDAGYADFGCYGSRDIPTPHIDRVAREGIRCTQGYVTASVCCPSRMGLMTGRYQQRFGAECNVPTIPTPGYTKDDLGLDPGEKTLGDVMRDQGYQTMAIGKWHLGELPQYHPNRRGFDEFYGFLGGSRSYWPVKKPGRGHAIRRDDEPVDEEQAVTYLTDDLTDAALDFIDRHRDRPFFIYLSYNAVHGPWHAKDEDVAAFEAIANEKRRVYAAMTKALDDNIGRLEDKLRNAELAENTLVIFLNDNGGAGYASDNGPLRNGKGSKFEGGIRVPFMFKWPAKLSGGHTYIQPVSALDVLPTIRAAAGATSTGDTSLDGVDLLPYLTGQAEGAPHEVLFWRRWAAAAVRKGPWKLIRVADNPLHEDPKIKNPLLLFNLDEDLGERTNRAEEFPEKASELLVDLENWEKELAPPRWYDGSRWQHWEQKQADDHRE